MIRSAIGLGACHRHRDPDADDTAWTNRNGGWPGYRRRKIIPPRSRPRLDDQWNQLQPILEYAFRTERYAITVTIHDEGTWSYELHTTLVIPGRAEPFLHTDRNTLMKIGEPTPNPTAQTKPTAASP